LVNAPYKMDDKVVKKGFSEWTKSR
jgi:hypothetical protein